LNIGVSRNRFCDFLADPDSRSFSRFGAIIMQFAVVACGVSCEGRMCGCRAHLASNHHHVLPFAIHVESPAHRKSTSALDVCSPADASLRATGYGWSDRNVLRPFPSRYSNHSDLFWVGPSNVGVGSPVENAFRLFSAFLTVMWSEFVLAVDRCLSYEIAPEKAFSAPGKAETLGCV
jgi:ABC-type uncharacterized transport system auxiliary subunit